MLFFLEHPVLTASVNTVSSGFPGGSVVKWVFRRCRRPRFNPWVGKIPWRRAWQPIPVFLPGKYHEQRNLAGYSPYRVARSQTGSMHKQLSFWYQHSSNKEVNSKISLFSRAELNLKNWSSWCGCGEKGTLVHSLWDCKFLKIENSTEPPQKIKNGTVIWSIKKKKKEVNSSFQMECRLY